MDPRTLPPDAPSVLTDYTPPGAPPEDRDRVGLHVGLFLLTFVSMVWAGGALVGRNVEGAVLPPGASFLEGVAASLGLFLDPGFVLDGLLYAVPFLAFLTVHEFGHYLMARRLHTRVSLPYYLPVPLPGTLGTLGAVIRIKEPLRRTRQLFDIGAAGPLAGAVVAVGVLVVGVLTLPGPGYLLDVYAHEATVAYLLETGTFPPFDAERVAPGSMALVFGDTPLFWVLNGLGEVRVPGNELVHYPVLLAGWLGLFFTALNLLPVGQLDGGHVVYALFGPAVHRVVARVTTLLLLLSGGLGFVLDVGGVMVPWQLWAALGLIYALAFARLFEGEWRLVVPAVVGALALTGLVVTATPGLAEAVGWSSWLVWVGLILFVIQVDHPPVLVRERLTPGRTALGYLCLVLFLLCFSIQPIQIVSG